MAFGDESFCVIVTGAHGLLGTPLVKALSRLPDTKVWGLGRESLDVADEEAVSGRFSTIKPHLVINCAAFTRVDDCETQEVFARRVNSDGARIVARAASEVGARLFHISTDYVFDGMATRPYTESSETRVAEVLSAYGRTKLLGERAVADSHSNALIVRTSWLYGTNGPSFPATILRLAREKPSLRVVNDQTGSPTYVNDVADALVKLIDTPANGIVHVTNSGTCTWYEFAREILRLNGISTPIEPCTTAEFPRPAKRPVYSVLDNGRLVELIGKPLRSWQEAIADFLSSYTPAS